MYDPNDPQSVEKFSSAVTLSDMEVFIFPELLLSLVLADAMSPRLWRWREEQWFKSMDKVSPYRRILRIKQYIMDNFIFNLDLDTWGLTTKEKEIERFSDIIDEAVLKESNALFGYEGDKYYFDMDIRRHFGLEKYDSNVIPYWKTETLEAMESFRFKEGYTSGAGECVSLSALYASALFVVAGIPFEDIYMLATPLHSQNFVDVGEGILTNNRRIVTKTMWFNGSELSATARRALENERVTIVAHESGYVHTLYEEATMDHDTYGKFNSKLKDFLATTINFETFTNFLRQKRELQKYFQLAHSCCGKPQYIDAEKVYRYEHSSKFRVSDNTRISLLHEIDGNEYYTSPHPNKIMLEDIGLLLKNNEISKTNPFDLEKLKKYLHRSGLNVESVVDELMMFSKTTPRLPDQNKKWISSDAIKMDKLSSKDEIIDYLDSIRKNNETAELAFMAYRDMSKAPWKPFFKAALERNPVCLKGSEHFDLNQVFEIFSQMENVSIYDGSRMAQPDEVWNYQRGDGLEKAICMMNVIKERHPDENLRLKGDGRNVCLCCEDGKEFRFESDKNLELPGDICEGLGSKKDGVSVY
jgi:hypothetical protein